MISDFFIEHPIFANVIAIITIILGLVCLGNLPVAQYPEIVPPTIQVSTSYPGASASVVADTIGVPIEQSVNGVEGSMYMTSTSGSDGSYTLTVTFKVGTDLNTSLSLVLNLVNSALSQLPTSVQAQGVTVKKVSPSILNVVSLYSEDDRFSETYLSNYSIINLENPLARLPGVGQIKVVGAGKYSMRVWMDPKKLQAYQLTVPDVTNAISQQNLQVVAGKLGAPPAPDDQNFQFTVNALGRLSEAEEFENIIIKAPRGGTTQGGTTTTQGGETAQIVRVKDVARVELSQQSYSYFARLSGHLASQTMIYALPGANALDVAAEVRTAMKEMSKSFPEGLKYDIMYDTTIFVEEAIHAVYETLIEAGILVLIVIAVFLQNFRAMLVPATTVPVTIIGAFAAMSLLGFSVNLMTLFALILSIGIVVDDAIVIVENAAHYVEKGFPPKEAASKAMKELTGPVIGITLVLTAVFLPAAFLPGITGQLFRQFALVIASTAIISAINALTLKPAQCAVYLRRQTKPPNLFCRGFNNVYGKVEGGYTAIVRWMVGHTHLMVVVFFIIVGLAGWRFGQQPTGFLPSEDQGYAIILARLPDASSQQRVRDVANKIDAVMAKCPGLKGWVTIGGFSILDAASVPTVSSTFATYEDISKRPKELTQEVIVGNIRRGLSTIEEAGFAVMIPPPISGLGQAGGFQMMLEDRGGVGLSEMQKVGMEVMRAANGQKELRGLTSTFSAKSPQLYLDIDRTKAESLGLQLSDVFGTLQAYLGSTYVNLFNKFGQVFQVYVQADAPYRLKPDDIKNLYVRNVQQQMVPLGTLINVKSMVSSELITRYQLFPAVPVFGGPAPGYSTGEALALMEQVTAHTLPQGMSAEWTATAFQEKQVGNQAYLIYLLSITLVFLVLAAQYESWTSPAAVIVVVPMALVGVLLALMIRDFDNNLYTQVGLVLMIALASKNAILVVEFARELRADGMSIEDAAVEATRRRFRPIVMTSFAFILGVVPLLGARGAGAASQQAIGTVVFGGMLSSTLVAIPFIPVFYTVMQRFSERRKKVEPAPADAEAQGASQ